MFLPVEKIHWKIFFRNFICFIGSGFSCYGNWSCAWLLFFFLVSIESSIIDYSSRVLNDIILGEVTVFIFGLLSQMTHDLFFLLVTEQDSNFPFGFLKMTWVVFIDSKASISWPVSINGFAFCDTIEYSFLGYTLLNFFWHDWLFQWFCLLYCRYFFLAFKLCSLSIMRM